ncbi:heme oxygenase [Vararia minispora EC-137]|uniref:Heme oxygenase n=1 Tax=Vararia minispora EC-137 TaxID=1314806 RepID=A0ACB8QF48_9AGAM|nr:heme oxygenase [Vararia minispora EC-137]
MSDPSLDLSQPIADLLRSGTAAAHETAEHSKGAGYLARGELTREEYARFLIMLYHVYSTLEQALEQHASHPVLAPTYNPALLSRAPALEADIAHILSVSTSALPNHPLWASLVTDPPPALSRYTARLRTLRDSSSPALLLAHGYVRYLGDLSGGQFIRRRVQKAYGLEGDIGTAFYEFGRLGNTAAHAALGDMKRIKEWYREGMNRGVGEDLDLKVMVLAEANRVFEFNNGLFETLEPPSKLSLPPPLLPPVHALGDPTSPIEPTKNERPYPLQVSGKSAEGTEPLGEGTYTTQGVVSFILAMCLAHFVLVVGGFTGNRGWEKYVTAMEWIAHTRARLLGM